MQIKSLKQVLNPAQSVCCSCGKQDKAHRRYNDEVFCAKCYFQWFPKKECAKCHKEKRIYRREKICADCLNHTDCVRCGKNAGTFPIGKITRYGAVCNACSLYFREEKTCFECGKVSRNVSSSPFAKHNELLCLSCYRKYSFATCKQCRRYRKVHNQDKQLCKKCDELGITTCPKCKGEMPAGYGTRCRHCARRELLFNAIKLNVRLFRTHRIRTAYKQFIFWYRDKFGISVALQRVTDHVIFFMTCDKEWNSIPDYSKLVTKFKPNGLREHLSVLRWLIDTKQIVINLELKDEIAEMQRIQSLFNKLSESVPCIATYYQKLLRKYENGKTSLKSVRLALQPAIDLLTTHSIITLPNQKQLESYLSLKIGQIAAITGFVNHLNQEYSLKLAIDKKRLLNIKEKYLAKHCKQRLSLLYQQSNLTNKDELELVCMAIYCLHQVMIKLPKKSNILMVNGTCYYKEDDNRYFLPQDIFQRLTF